jgi:hypothetical protein
MTKNDKSRSWLRTSSVFLAFGILPMAVPVLGWQPLASLSASPAPTDDPYLDRLAIVAPTSLDTETRSRTLAALPANHESNERATLLRGWTYTDIGNTNDQ